MWLLENIMNSNEKLYKICLSAACCELDYIEQLVQFFVSKSPDSFKMLKHDKLKKYTTTSVKYNIFVSFMRHRWIHNYLIKMYLYHL